MASSVKPAATRSGSWASTPACHSSRTARRTASLSVGLLIWTLLSGVRARPRGRAPEVVRVSVAGALPAVDVRDLAGDEGRLLQVQHRPDHVLDLAHPADRMQVGHGATGVGGVHRGADHPERDG